MKDRIVALDYETVELLPNGSTVASTEYYRDNFRVLSAAFSWRDGDHIRSKYVVGESAVQKTLATFKETHLVAHNCQFEIGVTRCRFPDLRLNWFADTMRMAQVYDNGGDENAFEVIHLVDQEVGEDPDGEEDDAEPKVKKIPLSGFGLVKCVKRILGLPDHKIEAYEYLRSQGVKKGQEGAHLNLLPPDLLERYNIADTENTLRLYEHLEEKFLELDYNWRFDHELFLSTVHYLVDSKIRGVYVDRERLAAYVEKVSLEIDAISQAFKDHFKEEIKVVERMRLIKRLRKYKKLKGKKQYLKNRPEKDWSKNVLFNTGSNEQLKMLFVDVLKIEPKFFTAKGSPAFRSSMLGQWGDGGLMLQKRRKRLIVLKQAENLLKLSEYDGRFHIDLKAVGTSTGRAAGGNH
jgi:hypothetical protein